MKHDFTIGADPEFLIATSTARPISAYSWFNRYDRTSIRMLGDGANANDTVFGRSQFGQDGSGRPFELRPKPSRDPLAVVEDIGRILSDAVDVEPTLQSAKWLAGPCPCNWPLGGHVHFGVHGLSYHEQDCISALDDYVGTLLCLVEGPEGAKRRSRYGAAGDVRTQDWGFEYRTPSSWLVSPSVSAAVLCLSKAVAYEVIFSKCKHLSLRRFSQSEIETKQLIRYDGRGAPVFATIKALRSLITYNRLDLIRQQFDDIWTDITKMKLYREYHAYIDVFRFLITNKLSWYPKVSMQKAWGIEQPSYPLPSELTMESIWTQPNPQ